jgi:hypothetical protein
MIIGISQHGQIFHNLGKHPRKELLKRLNRKHCSKMYRGAGQHVGYVIAGMWIELFETWENPKGD